jgi:hypothetical protein
MTTLIREPGTYRTRAGMLVHLRASADGTITIQHEDARSAGRMGGADDLVKLSDDPDWPDITPVAGDPALFVD